MKNNNIILSGIQPSGELHIGNYLSAIKNWVELQKQYPSYFFIADYHSLTESYDPQKKLQQIYDLAADLLSAGIDPKKSVIFVQSQVPQCTELAWIFNTITPIAELYRMTQFKEKSNATTTFKDLETELELIKKSEKEYLAPAVAEDILDFFGTINKNNTGLLDYPVLQAADILLYRANLVPVGKDQVQHVELTREIARRFNHRFGQTFPEPKSILTPTPKIMSLLEPEKKMSKSAGPDHYLGINDEPMVIRAKLKRAVTGLGTEEKIPQGAENLLNLLREFGAKEEYEKFRKTQDNKTIKYSELKETLAQVISQYFADFRKRRKEWSRKPKEIKKILAQGAKKAGAVAEETMTEVKKKIGLI